MNDPMGRPHPGRRSRQGEVGFSDTRTTMLRVGDPAPDVELISANEQRVRLSSFWARGPVVLVFSRHFG